MTGNVTEKRKERFLLLVLALLAAGGILLLTVLWQQRYQEMAYGQLSDFCGTVLAEHPELEDEILSSLKKYLAGEKLPEIEEVEKESMENAFLSRYGYAPRNFGSGPVRVMYLWTVLVAGAVLTAFYAWNWRVERKKRKRIQELAGYLEEVNTGGAAALLPEKEDDFSVLQDEIYKTVTELRTTGEAAAAARKSFADNLANIAHQLKTPLTAADLSLQLMEKEAAEPVRRQLKSLSRLEEALLTLSRIDAGTLALEEQSVDAFTVLNLAAENLQELLAQKKVNVHIPERETASFTGDLEWTMEALLNLMKNCLEHSPEGGTIWCDYSANPLYTQMEIRDEGPGFAPEDLPHLFERFYRGKNAAPEGSGIGLALARSILESENGVLAVRNHPAGGAVFEIRIYSH